MTTEIIKYVLSDFPIPKVTQKLIHFLGRNNMPRRFRPKKFKSSLKKIFTRKCIIHGKIIMSHRIGKEPNPAIPLGHLHHTPRQKVVHHTRLLSNMTQTAPFIVPQFSYGSIFLAKNLVGVLRRTLTLKFR